jgi:histidine triad (HIT) family protein
MSCLFCRIAAGEIPSRAAYQDDEVFAFHDIAPQAPTHVLVIPRAHARSFQDMDAAAVGALLSGAHRAAAALGLTETDGYRLVVNCGERAGQSVWHVHVHLLAGRSFGWPPG